MCFKNHKCNWCNKRKSDILIINIWCKWYGYKICEECYDKKMKGYIKYPLHNII